jgi:anti-sigma regulatory factor (Ser/Thr protein kinase)
MKDLDPEDGTEIMILRLVVVNHFIEIDRVNNEFNNFAERCSIDDSVRRKVNLVFDELLNNIISYAFLDQGEHHIHIEVKYHPSKLVIRIADDGTPYNIFETPAPKTDLPLKERQIGGLGIHLVRQVMDEYDYQRVGDENILVLRKHLDGRTVKT